MGVHALKNLVRATMSGRSCGAVERVSVSVEGKPARGERGGGVKLKGSRILTSTDEYQRVYQYGGSDSLYGPRGSFAHVVFVLGSESHE